MKKVWLSPYSLHFKNSSRKRRGFLLKVSTNEFETGYADIFPWPEFGDPDVDQIKELIKNNQTTPLLLKSFEMAQRDGEARRDQYSLLDGLKIKNHFLVADLNSFDHLSKPLSDTFLRAQDQGFNRFKIKVCGNSWSEEYKMISDSLTKLNSNSLLRLDCNLKAPSDFFSQIGFWNSCIEFVEDPFVDHKLWPHDQILAYDHPPFSFDSVRTDWQIIKPAYQNREQIKAQNIIFTSSLDHPVGMAHAFYEAYQFCKPLHDYGLMSHNTYEPNEFYTSVIQEGPWLSFEGGFGIGFQKQLENQDWELI